MPTTVCNHCPDFLLPVRDTHAGAYFIFVSAIVFFFRCRRTRCHSRRLKLPKGPQIKWFTQARSASWQRDQFHCMASTVAITLQSIWAGRTRSLVETLSLCFAWEMLSIVTPKEGSDRIRVYINLSCLNAYVKRKIYQSLTPAKAACRHFSEQGKVLHRDRCSKVVPSMSSVN